jgi:DNA-binding transcriptional LysR family regulator
VDKFDAMQVFVRVVEKGSFSAVAKERGIGQPAVSKQISALEDELGTELIHRTSRSIAMTEAGRGFYESALRILDDFESATSQIGRNQTSPKGLIRVTVPPTFARLHMVSKLPAFFLPTRTWQSRWPPPRARQRSSRTASIWLSTQGISQTPLWSREGSRRR